MYDAVVIGAGQAGLSASYHLRWLGIASYDPTFDANGQVLRSAIASARSLTDPKSPTG